MRLPYEIAKQKGGQFYVHPWGVPSSPVKGSFGDKRHATKIAARLCGMTPAEYADARKKEGRQ